MGLFGLGKKKNTAAPSANEKISLSGGTESIDTLKCIMTAGLRNVDLDINLSEGTAGPEMSHGSFNTSGEQAITTYLDIKGQGGSLRPKKARHLGTQNYWMQVANQCLDCGEQTEKVLASMNTLLNDQEYLAGPLSLADAHVAASVYQLKKSGTYPDGMSHIDAWLTRVENQIAEPLRARFLEYTH